MRSCQADLMPQPGIAGGEVKAVPDIADFRKRQALTPALPYEVLFPVDSWNTATRATADDVLRGEWRDMHYPPLDMRPPVAWDELVSLDRIREFRIQSWHALGPVLAAHDNTGEDQYLQFALALALDWVRQQATLETASHFLWYHMAVGARAHRLGYIVDRAIRNGSIDATDLAALMVSIRRHVTELSDETRFPAHSNQGLFVAAGQLSLARRLQALPGMDESGTQARDRLLALLDAQFTDEGVHREHSPEYHLRTLQTLEGLVSAGLLTGDEIVARCERARAALAWFLLPDGRLVTFGDTAQAASANPAFSDDGALTFETSGDREEPPATAAMRAFPHSGYVVIRGEWPPSPDERPADFYLAQTCAFHSRVHKHADDLSFVWYDRGHELLIDPGKYGYFGQTDADSDLAKAGFWYSDPNRVYVESTRAHNTVEIDDLSYPRREADPYGSALGRWGVSHGVAFAESEVTHFGSVRHARVLLYRPGEWLIVFDWLSDSKRQPHRFTQRFHFAPELALLPGDDSPRFAVPGVDELLRIVPLLQAEPCVMVSGQRGPQILGWLSRREGVMEPCWTAAYSAVDVPRTTFATLLAFGCDLIVTSSLDWTASKANADGRKAILRWQQGSRVHTVEVARTERDPLAVSYRTVAANG